MGLDTSIRTVDLVLTPRCNLRCAYCFENQHGGAPMSWDVARAAIDSGLSTGRGGLRVVFFGGEPTLEFATIRRTVAHVAARRATRRVRFVLVTNGTRLAAEDVAFLARHRIATQISCDGSPAAQALRGRKTFEKVDALLDTLRTNHRAFFESSVSVAMTLTPRTIPFLERSVAYLLTKDVREIGMTPDIGGDAGWSETAIGDLDRAFAAVCRLVREHFRATGHVPVRLLRKGAKRAGHTTGPVAMCSVAHGGRLAVDVNGSVLLCGVFARSIQRFQSTSLGAMLGALDLGDVREPGLAERVAAIPVLSKSLRIFHDKQDKRAGSIRCGRCPHLHACAICPASIAQLQGNDDPDRVPEFACAFNRVWLRHRSRFPARRPASPARSRRASTPAPRF